MKTYEESKIKWIKIQMQLSTIETRMENLKKKKNKLWNMHWTDMLIRPLMKQVEQQMPEIKFEKENYTPMGLCSRVSIFPKYRDKTLMICFVPGHDNEPLRVETGERNSHFPPGSIGHMNDMGKTSVPVVSVQQIVDLLQKQIDNPPK